MENDLIITIPNEGNDANVAITKEDGTIDQKTVSLNDIITNLASSYKFSTGLLPRGTRAFSGSSVTYSIVIEAAARRREISHEDLREVVPFPHCIFAFYVKNNTISNTRLYCRPQPLESDSDFLYNFPFGNVYHNDGRICWGSVSLPEIRTPMNLIGVVNMFFTSGFNGDLFDPGVSFNHPVYTGKERRINSLANLIRYMSKRDVFPADMLIESAKTLNNLTDNGGRDE